MEDGRKKVDGGMAKRTKKVLVTGNLGARYGSGIRKRVLWLEKTRREVYRCEKCTSTNIKRVASGIWVCMKCGNKFAGSAYVPRKV